jgi:hypothetical protein
MLDVGLLAAKAELELKTFLNPDARIFKEFNGAFAEQFVMQELKATEKTALLLGTKQRRSRVGFCLAV